ncbi:hypothetical protein NQ317_000023, partial [Molorchus minor]
DRARDVSQRLSSTTTLTVNIKDDDDLPPTFIYKACMLLDGACINRIYIIGNLMMEYYISETLI